MLKKITNGLVYAVLAGGFIANGDAQVKIADSGEIKSKHGELTRVERKIEIKNGGAVPYNLAYRYIPGPVPSLGDSTTRSLGIGLSPSAWYWNGFLGVEIDNKTVNSIAGEIRVLEGKERGAVEFIWKETWGEMSLKFVVLSGDDKLYVEIALEPTNAVSSVNLRLIAMPGHLGSVAVPNDCWAATAERSIQYSKTGYVLELQKEYWALSFDANDNKQFGSCAFLYLPEQIEKAEVNLASYYSVITTLTLKKDARKARFLLWNFPDNFKKQDQAYLYLKENGESFLKALRNFKF